MPKEIDLTPADQLLSYEEIAQVAKAGVELGIVHYRLTGGEPLVRPEVDRLVAMLKAIQGVKTVTLTTNGVLLKDRIKGLKDAGLDGVNVSLDTVDRESFQLITGRDRLETVLAGIEAAKALDIPLKLNAVYLKNQDYHNLIAYAGENHLLLRFIEMMPIGYGKAYPEQKMEAFPGILEKTYGKAVKTEEKFPGNGPAVYYRFEKLEMPIGMIQAIHGKFCDSCNRVRLTAQGQLKLCLCYEDGVDLREILRKEPENLKMAMKKGIWQKPVSHCFSDPGQMTEIKTMVKIGG
jgi:cyclic pyranopterin phosphate synthase